MKQKRIQEFEILCKNIKEYKDLGIIDFSTATNFSYQGLPYKPEKSYPLESISFKCENVINTIIENPECCVLVFASAKNPGGGVLNGAIAQEETISLHTTWYFQAQENQSFYLNKGANAINSDNVAFAKGFLITNEYHNFIDPQTVSFVACAAPNLKGLSEQKIILTEKELYETISFRIEKILSCAEFYKQKHLILGAWGCGVFSLNPELVATIFKKKISQGFFSGKITFSIFDNALLNTFKETFNDKFSSKKIKF